MTDTVKKERTLQDVQQDYTQHAAKLGHAHTQIRVLETEIKRTQEAIDGLILEQAALVRKANEEKKAQDAKTDQAT